MARQPDLTNLEKGNDDGFVIKTSGPCSTGKAETLKSLRLNGSNSKKFLRRNVFILNQDRFGSGPVFMTHPRLGQNQVQSILNGHGTLVSVESAMTLNDQYSGINIFVLDIFRFTDFIDREIMIGRFLMNQGFEFKLGPGCAIHGYHA